MVQDLLQRLRREVSECSWNAGDRQAVAALWEACPRWSSTQDTSVTRLQPGPGGDVGLAALVRAGWQSTLVQPTNPVGAPGASCSDAQALALLKAWGIFRCCVPCAMSPAGVLALNRSLAHALGFPLEGWYRAAR